MKPTAASIRTIVPVPPKTDIIEFDDAVPGFGVRARQADRRSTSCSTRSARRPAACRSARSNCRASTRPADKAKDILATVRLGKDPAARRSKIAVRPATRQARGHLSRLQGDRTARGEL